MEELIFYGKKIIASGLAHSHFGNVSKRVGDRLLISSTGSMLDELAGQIIETPLNPETPDDMDILASTELNVHREIYRTSSTLAVLHGHSPFAVIVSLLMNAGEVVRPLDNEALLFLHEIPIIEGRSGSRELAQAAAGGLREHRAVMVRGHGVFARGATVDEAFVVLCTVEHACKVKYHVDLARK